MLLIYVYTYIFFFVSSSSLYFRFMNVLAWVPLAIIITTTTSTTTTAATKTVTKFIRIGIADKNDNPPYFDKSLYEAEVDENEDIQHTVLTVTAKDHDECK